MPFTPTVCYDFIGDSSLVVTSL